MALKLIQGLDKARLEQTSRSPMFLADAIRTLTNFSSKNAIATEKIATMLGEWSDAMISGLSFTYKRAGALMSKNPKLTKEQALVSTLRADGLSANNVAKIKNCALF